MWSKPTSAPASAVLRTLACVLALLASGCAAGTSVDTNPPLTDDAPRVVIETNFGSITVGLYAEQAPISVANFLNYVEQGFFDGTSFHRVIPGFMIQGGGYVPTGRLTFERKERMPTIALESDNGLKNFRGTVAMARGGMADSATSEFFINLVDNQRLDRLGDVNLGYAVFGVVLEGMDVVDAIAAVEADFSPQFPTEPAAPIEDVLILSVRGIDD